MGGGKSRAISERALDYALEYPGTVILIARQKHTAIVETTKKTMMEEVLDPRLIKRSKASLGEDFVQLVNGSTIHFIGLDDPVRWYSAQIGVLIVDQVEECDEDTIVKLITRLRHPKSPMGVLPDSPEYGEQAGQPIAGKVILSFNPESPGHWLMSWFLSGQRTKFGFEKKALFAKDANAPMGDSAFFFAKATDNPHLPAGYVEQTLMALPEHLRRRYLDGLWEFISGTCFFDTDALAYYQRLAQDTLPLWNAYTVGDCKKDADARIRRKKSDDPVKLRKGDGPWQIFALPKADHRYVAGIDTSSGGAQDFSAIQVVCVEDFEVVAEFQGKLDPDLVGEEAYRIGRIYNNALLVAELTGGYGFTVDQTLKRLKYPNPYTRKRLDRLSKKWTDVTGWDTTVKTRFHMLDNLERAIRERELGIYSLRTVGELGTFVRDDAGRPAAQPGCHDDLVIGLSLAVTITMEMPRQLRKLVAHPHRPAVSSVTGY